MKESKAIEWTYDSINWTIYKEILIKNVFDTAFAKAKSFYSDF